MKRTHRPTAEFAEFCKTRHPSETRKRREWFTPALELWTKLQRLTDHDTHDDLSAAVLTWANAMTRWPDVAAREVEDAMSELHYAISTRIEPDAAAAQAAPGQDMAGTAEPQPPKQRRKRRATA